MDKLDGKVEERAGERNICDTCGRPYIVNINYDKHDCDPLVQKAVEWLQDEKWEEGDTPEDDEANLAALLDSEIPEWLAAFARSERAEELAAARAEIVRLKEVIRTTGKCVKCDGRGVWCPHCDQFGYQPHDCSRVRLSCPKCDGTGLNTIARAALATEDKNED